MHEVLLKLLFKTYEGMQTKQQDPPPQKKKTSGAFWPVVLVKNQHNMHNHKGLSVTYEKKSCFTFNARKICWSLYKLAFKYLLWKQSYKFLFIFFTILKLRFYANKIKFYMCIRFLEIHIFIHPLILL